MNRNPNSLGLEWNVARLDATAGTIDAIPLRRHEVSIDEVEALACEGAWERFNYATHSPSGTVPPNHSGWVCFSSRAAIWLRFLYKGGDGLRALYALQETEQHQLPQALAAALYTVEYLFKAGNSKAQSVLPAAVARFCATMRKLPSTRLVRLNREGVEKQVDSYIRISLNAGEHPVTPDLPSYVDRARLAIRAMEKLWEPSLLAQINYPPDILSPIGYLASSGTLLASTKGKKVELDTGAKYRVPFPHPGSMDEYTDRHGAYRCWIEALLACQTSIGPRQADALFGYDASKNFAGNGGPYSLQVPVTDDLNARMMSTHNALITETKQNQRYVASGEFLLELPASTYWHAAGWRHMAIAAHAHGLWFAPIDGENRRGMLGYWQPEIMTETENDYAYIALSLAAIWHDLLVAGDTVIIESAGTPRPRTPEQTTISTNGKQRKGQPVINLPRKQIHITGHRQWSTKDDQEIIQHQSRGASAHARTLPVGWHASQDALDRAAELNVALGEGQTFVRGHLPTDRSETTQPRRARARGLATLAYLSQGGA